MSDLDPRIIEMLRKDVRTREYNRWQKHHWRLRNPGRNREIRDRENARRRQRRAENSAAGFYADDDSGGRLYREALAQARGDD